MMVLVPFPSDDNDVDLRAHLAALADRFCPDTRLQRGLIEATIATASSNPEVLL
jgi:hypothetical protein